MKRLALLSLLAGLTTAAADPQLTSRFTANSGQYARISQSTANATAGTKSATWTHGTDTPTNSMYADVNEIAYSTSWKDTLYVPKGETVDVIAKYDDFASNTNPFMFHCHFLQHEDGGMMGQFVVVNSAVEDLAIASFTRAGANSNITLVFKSTISTTYTLQYSSDLTTGSWTAIGSVTSDGTSANFTETDATRLGQARGFYRVTIPTVP